MTRKRIGVLCTCAVATACLLTSIPMGLAATTAEQAEADARAAMDAYFKAFNAADNDTLQTHTNYPHAFVGANGSIRIEDERVEINFDRMRDDEGWHHSTLESAEAFLIKEDKVHFNMVFSRQKADGTTYRTTPGLWIMTKQDGNWGLSLRSY